MVPAFKTLRGIKLLVLTTRPPPKLSLWIHAKYIWGLNLNLFGIPYCFHSTPRIYNPNATQVHIIIISQYLKFQAAELLRNPHLQPYLLRCRNPSSVFLPVKPTNNTKDKPRKSSSPNNTKDKPRKPSSRRSSNGNHNGVMEVRVLEDVEPFLPLGETIDKQSTS